MVAEVLFFEDLVAVDLGAVVAAAALLLVVVPAGRLTSEGSFWS